MVCGPSRSGTRIIVSCFSLAIVGVKPLHYLAEPTRFVFASELKSFLHLRDFTARENEDEMRRQLTTGVDSPEQTLLEGVKLLRPGHNMVVSASGICTWRWCTLDHLVDVPRRFPDQVEQFRELFFDACRLRLRCAYCHLPERWAGFKLDSVYAGCDEQKWNEPPDQRLPSRVRRHF